MKKNEEIYNEIKESGMISKSNLQILKNRSNREQKDQFDYNFMDKFGDGYGIPLTEEQGLQGINWLKKFIRKDGSSNVYGYRELDIIELAVPSDFRFQGFYDAGNGCFRNYLPIYELAGMQYIPMKEPYIIG